MFARFPKQFAQLLRHLRLNSKTRQEACKKRLRCFVMGGGIRLERVHAGSCSHCVVSCSLFMDFSAAMCAIVVASWDVVAVMRDSQALRRLLQSLCEIFQVTGRLHKNCMDCCSLCVGCYKLFVECRILFVGCCIPHVGCYSCNGGYLRCWMV